MALTHDLYCTSLSDPRQSGDPVGAALALLSYAGGPGQARSGTKACSHILEVLC
jgi:hypothetical protein